jgi:hypothetical protein
VKSNLSRSVSVLGFGTAFLLLAALIFLRDRIFPQETRPPRQARLIRPRIGDDYDNTYDDAAYLEGMNAKVALKDGEIILEVLTEDLDQDQEDEQLILLRRPAPGEVFLSYVDRDETGYAQVWMDTVSLSRAETASLRTRDLIGDRSVSVLVEGMNDAGERTLTIFSLSGREYRKIADLRTDGSITVLETERPPSYQRGLARGRSYDIAVYSRDELSSNILDRVERIWAYNPQSGIYEQSRLTRIPAPQVEQRLVREILGGGVRHFERFIEGLWYYVSPQGALDGGQYLYFDTANREIIFFGDETQQVFSWQNSSSTRYGLYITSQNISVSTLKRSLDIELESLESVRVRVNEDVRLKIGVSLPWDGSYRKAIPISAPAEPERPYHAHIEGLYSGSLGRLILMADGSYELLQGSVEVRGNYSFYFLDHHEFLELRPQNRERELYQVSGESPGEERREQITLTPVRIGTQGILHDPRQSPVSLHLQPASPPVGFNGRSALR